jgi:tetratricopeptide (TPR) repeat protein
VVLLLKKAGVLPAATFDTPALLLESTKKALERDPRDAHQLFLKGMALERLDRPAEAREVFLATCVQGYRPGTWLLPVHIGCVMWTLGERDEARVWFDQAIEAFPDDSHPAVRFGQHLAQAGRLDEAEAILRPATRHPNGPDDEAHQWLGLVLRSQGRYAEALEHLDRALEMDREFWAPTGVREDVARTLDRFPEPT